MPQAIGPFMKSPAVRSRRYYSRSKPGLPVHCSFDGFVVGALDYFMRNDTSPSKDSRHATNARGLKTPMESLLVTSTDQKAAAMKELRRYLTMPTPPVPQDSLVLLHEAACQDTGASQACRSFLFWLVGKTDPTGYVGTGGFELRRMDGELKNAAIEVLRWWSGPTKSAQPLYDILASLHLRFGENRDQNQLQLLFPTSTDRALSEPNNRPIAKPLREESA